MQSPLQMKDFIEFEDLFNELSKEVYGKKVREKLTSNELVEAF